MRALDELIYDPRKLFAAVILVFWVFPIALVLALGITAGATGGSMRNTGVNDSVTQAQTRTGSSDNNVAGTMHSNQNMTNGAACSGDPDNDGDATMPGKDDGCTVHKQSNQAPQPLLTGSSSCECRQVKQTSQRPTASSNNLACQTAQCMTSQTQPPVQKTTVIERTRLVPQRTTVIREVPPPANASAAASAVVNFAQPQVAAATANPSTTTTATASGNNASVSTNTSAAPATSNVSDSKALPNTGAGSVVSFFVLISLAAAAGHYLYQRRLS